VDKVYIILQKLSFMPPHNSGGFVKLFVSKGLIQGLAAAMMGVFLPIFLYEVSGNQFWFVVLFFIGATFGYILLLVPGMKLTNIIGFNRALSLGALFSVMQFGILYFMDEMNYLMLLIPLLVSAIGFKVFHWVPYHVDFTVFTTNGERGRDVSLILATHEFMGMVGPALAGYIIVMSGYESLFMVAMALLLIATITYLFVPAIEEQFTWSFKETFSNLFSERFRNVFIGEVGNGAEVVVTLVAWPIFLYEVLNQNVLEVGFLSAVIVAATIILQLMVGKYLDTQKGSKRVTLRRGSIFYAIGWIIKIFVVSATQVFLVGLYHNIARIFTQTPLNAKLYDMSGEQGSYVDEFTVIKEIASAMGRMLALAIMLVLTLYVSVAWTFVVGAIAALMVNAIYRVQNQP